MASHQQKHMSVTQRDRTSDRTSPAVESGGAWSNCALPSTPLTATSSAPPANGPLCVGYHEFTLTYITRLATGRGTKTGAARAENQCGMPGDGALDWARVMWLVLWEGL